MMSVIQVFRRLFQFSVEFNIFKVMAFTKSQRLFMLTLNAKIMQLLPEDFPLSSIFTLIGLLFVERLKNLEKMAILLLVVQRNDLN